MTRDAGRRANALVRGIIFQAVGFFRVESCPTQAVLPLVGLAAEKGIRDRYIFQAVEFFRVESCPTQAVLPLVGLAAEKVIRDRYITFLANDAVARAH